MSDREDEFDECRLCGGTGKIRKPCSECNGSGYVRSDLERVPTRSGFVYSLKRCPRGCPAPYLMNDSYAWARGSDG